MTKSFEDIEQQARNLSPDDRAKLAEALLESLREPPLTEIEAAWAREIEERMAAYDRGEIEEYEAEDIFAQARRLSR